MATRSGRPMLNDNDPYYTQRMLQLTTRCRDLREKMEAVSAERAATFTPRQRAARLIAESYWRQFINERNWDRRQPLLQRAFDAYLEFEATVEGVK